MRVKWEGMDEGPSWPAQWHVLGPAKPDPSAGMTMYREETLHAHRTQPFSPAGENR